MTDHDPLNSQSLGFVEGLYENFLQNRDSVSKDWQSYFDKLTPGRANRIGPSFKSASIFNPPSDGREPGRRDTGGTDRAQIDALQERVDMLIRNYRVRGHIIAQVDPLGRPRPPAPELDYKYFSLTEADLDRPFSSEQLSGPDTTTLRDIIGRLRNTYCRTIGAQFYHIDDLVVRTWLQERMEATENRVKLSRREQLRILTRLTDATIFEDFIQKKFIGAKSFSLEGAESLIPLLDMAIEKAGEQGVREIVLGMAHRGRLNVLANIMGKNARQIFREFEDKDTSLHRAGGGDVKYHLGHSTDWVTMAGPKIHLSLCFNPSHLEYVNPVVLGRMRAKQDRVGDTDRLKGLAILIHGDAAFAGEGICQETLNLSELHGYTVGGAIHIVVNNQIGFTTDPGEGRSSIYATDIAKMLQTPIFHVNGEDPEAVAQVVRLSMDFRREFQRDVVIDMYCYRRRGHNESDEPSFTQPLLYKAIEARKTVREGYLEHLLALGGVTRDEADRIAVARREHLEHELTVARAKSGTLMIAHEGIWGGYRGGLDKDVPEVPTSVEKDVLVKLLEAQTKLPPAFHASPKIAKILDQRNQAAHGKRPIDWAMGEALALASLATQGFRVRLSGQDVARGTFSHRHAVLYDFENGETHCALQHLDPKQAPVEIINSPLSESGVLGFEYGYSLDWPDGLVIWEAQFGDFWNVAQPIVDQFITSAEEKWQRLSGLVMFLPHGLEGQGPEHSSARLERFLMNAAKDNIQVIYPTTPAQIFHALRRQVLRKWRKPLVVMTPKSLLRHPQAVSTLDDLANGSFQRVIPDAAGAARQRAGGAPAPRVLMCSGKIYYELFAEREERKRADVDIVRVEQLYPLPQEQLKALLSTYAPDTSVVWVQEEPENMGAWRFLRVMFGEKMFGAYPLTGVSRAASASPATGSMTVHKREQKEVMEKAFS
ncbi:MAG TPA: 2-oxoglutarate dehydrogenase E1 component [Planctomycetota bacterium]|nr:2-oxoglutarate dehydrogenase E1 component [Planctomycetota bacterium]